MSSYNTERNIKKKRERESLNNFPEAYSFQLLLSELVNINLIKQITNQPKPDFVPR